MRTGRCIPRWPQRWAPLWSTRQLAFVPFAGTEDISRSHFETQDNIELGPAAGASRHAQRPADAGWPACWQGPRAIAFTDSLPVSFRGAGDVPNISLKSGGQAGLR